MAELQMPAEQKALETLEAYEHAQPLLAFHLRQTAMREHVLACMALSFAEGAVYGGRRVAEVFG